MRIVKNKACDTGRKITEEYIRHIWAETQPSVKAPYTELRARDMWATVKSHRGVLYTRPCKLDTDRLTYISPWFQISPAQDKTEGIAYIWLLDGVFDRIGVKNNIDAFCNYVNQLHNVELIKEVI